MSFNPTFTDWQGKSVWLVGASSGIGEATATALHAAGARVFVSARNAAAPVASTHPPLPTTRLLGVTAGAA